MENLKNIPYRKWPEIFEGLGLKKYAVLQVYQWLFKKSVTSFEEMTNLSKDARKILAENYYISRLKVVDTLTDPDDGTKKFLFELEDGEKIESVMIPMGEAGDCFGAEAPRNDGQGEALDCVADARNDDASVPARPQGRSNPEGTDESTGLLRSARNDGRESSSHCEEAEPTKQSPETARRLTLCISSQVGCALGCVFCRTAGLGFKRNLTTSEIVDQVLEVRRYLMDPRRHSPATTGESSVSQIVDPPAKPEDDRGVARDCVAGARNDFNSITNIVFMGMGEPLNNYENVREALSILISEHGVMLAKRRITISTAGVVPGIQRMAIDDLGVKLAISLNATTDEVRQKIMPIAKTYTIDQTIEACRDYRPAGDRWRTTFEYVLIDGLNDTPEDMKRLLKLMRRLPSKVNLIPFNPFPESDYRPAKEKVLKEFSNYLYNNNIHTNIRKSRGQNILAACGQLAGRKDLS